MTEKKEEMNDVINEATPEEISPNEEMTPDGEENETVLLQKELAQAKELLAQREDRYLRTLAEFDNFKKRSAREKEDLFFSARCEVIRSLLPVFDNLERAQKYSNAEDYQKGVDMIINQFFEILRGMDIQEIAKVGDEFDPRFHEAVFREEKEGVPENTITELLQKGYAIGDKVIRHAMVKVSG